MPLVRRVHKRWNPKYWAWRTSSPLAYYPADRGLNSIWKVSKACFVVAAVLLLAVMLLPRSQDISAWAWDVVDRLRYALPGG